MPTLKKNLPILSLLTLVFLCVPTLAFAGDGIQMVLWSIVNAVFGGLMGLSGLLLDAGVEDFVVGFGDNFSTGGAGIVVDTLWVNVRDIFNITFIFGLVYIGFKMILNSDDSNTRRWLVSLILAALLVNFSLFITKFIVDFSNILATQIYNGGFGGISISTSFMNSLGLNSILGGSDVIKEGAAGYGYIFGAMMMFIVGTFVFAAGGFMLIIRYAALCLYMVMSPLMFLGWVFPGLQSVTSSYWRGFLGRAFFAPVYLLLVYFAYSIVAQFYGKGGMTGPNFKNLFGASGQKVEASFSDTMPPFILACVFLIASVVIANKLSADGASTALKIGGDLRNRAQRRMQKTAIGGARLAASPVTKGGGAIARHYTNKVGIATDRAISNLQRRGGVVGGIARNTAFANSARGAASSMTNAKYGLRNTVAQDEKEKAAINNQVATHKTLKAGQAAQKENARYNPETQAIIPGTGEVVDRSSITNPATLAEIKKAEEARELAIAEAQKSINSLSQKELEDMYSSDKEMFDSVVGQLKSGQFDKLMESDTFTADQKSGNSGILASRQKAIKDTFTKNGVELTENLQNLSIKQIETLGDDFIRQNAHQFSQSQMDSILKSDNFTEGQKGAYSSARKQTQIKMAQDPATISNLFTHNTPQAAGMPPKRRKAAEIASLPFEALTQPDSLKHIDASVLEEIYNKKTLTADQRNQLKEALILSPGVKDSATDYFKSAQGVRNWG